MMQIRLKEWRERRLLTQAELAARIGVSVGTINRIERGVHQPRLRTIRLVAAALDVPPDQLVVRDDPGEEQEVAKPNRPGT
jgi:transcriptional regulator with XRE-family HTH domain